MKTIRFSALTRLLPLFLITLIAFSCKKEDDEPEAVDNNPIVGSWQFVSVAPETPGTTIAILAQINVLAPCIGSLVLTFNSNNTVEAKNCDMAVTAMSLAGFSVNSETRWKVASGKLKLTNGTTVKEFPITQSATEAKITVNTNTDPTTAAVNAVIVLKKV